MRIMLVGFEHDSSASLMATLSEAGHDVVAGTHGWGEGGDADAVVLDALAPVSMVREVLGPWAGGPEHALIVVAEPGHPVPSWIPAGGRLDAVLTKPMDVRQLVDVLRGILSRLAASSESSFKGDKDE